MNFMGGFLVIGENFCKKCHNLCGIRSQENALWVVALLEMIAGNTTFKSEMD